MAVDLLSHESSSMVFSPRISFSYDLHQAEPISIDHQRSDTLLLASNTEFDFCTSNSFEEEDSSFDQDLFSQGRILPIQIKKPNEHPNPPSSPPSTSSANNSKKESLKEIIDKSFKEEEKASSSLKSKSFWRFKRSSSCNGNPRSLIICSLPILSRSNSTPNPKKDNHKHSHKPSMSNASIKTCSSFYPYSSEKAPLKKNKYRSYGNGVQISPILNVPPPYISKGAVNLFGFGYIFCNGKSKSKLNDGELVYVILVNCVFKVYLFMSNGVVVNFLIFFKQYDEYQQQKQAFISNSDCILWIFCNRKKDKTKKN